jgi:predicted HNH restriction endonuclease
MSDAPRFSAKQYVQAFRRHGSKTSDEQRAMLKAHAEAPGKILSTVQLAQAAGSKAPQRTHVAYGQLGHALAQILDPRTRRLPGRDRIWTRYLGVDNRDPETNDVMWRMYPEVAEALYRLGWASLPNRKQKARAATSRATPKTYLFVTHPNKKPEKVLGKRSKQWSCGKTVRRGDSVFVYVTGKGIRHEWMVAGPVEPDPKWAYSCPVKFISDVQPLISIQELRELIPYGVWAPPHLNFRGNHCIEVPDAATKIIRRLRNELKGESHPRIMREVEKQFEIDLRKAKGRSVAQRQARLRHANRYPEKLLVMTVAYSRNADVVAEVLRRAKGRCEDCRQPAPFRRASDGSPYLEVHHRIRLSVGGEDTTRNAAALCPNCHRLSHFGPARRSRATAVV